MGQRVEPLYVYVCVCERVFVSGMPGPADALPLLHRYSYGFIVPNKAGAKRCI